MKVLALLAACIVMATVVNAGPILRIEDLGTLGGSHMSGAAINAFGQVAGTGLDAQGYLRAFSAMNSPTDLTPVWATSASANGISSSGQVVGATYVNGNSQATLWSSGTAQQIGGLGGPDSYALAINDNQEIAGWATTPQGQGHAVMYSNGGVRDINLPAASSSSAYAIDSSGNIVGTAMVASGVFRAYTWSPVLGFTTLGTLGGASSRAFGMNDSGQVVGNSNTANGYAHAFLSDASGMRDLGTLGGQSSYAYGINNAGSVVGYASLGGVDHAFLYSGGIMFDLNLVVSSLAGWELTAAYAINDSGQITGDGLFQGVEHVFRLDPGAGVQDSSIVAPEPDTNALVLIGAAVLIGGALLKRRT